jgi:hypothetical protein
MPQTRTLDVLPATHDDTPRSCVPLSDAVSKVATLGGACGTRIEDMQVDKPAVLTSWSEHPCQPE